MKFTYEALYVLSKKLDELAQMDLPFREARKYLRFMDAMREEIKIVNPLYTKVMAKYSSGIDQKTQRYILPKEGEKKFDEFEKEYMDIMGANVDVAYEKIDIDALGVKNPDIKPAILAVLEDLNKVYDLQNKKEENGDDKSPVQ